jgi:hypothetical protein
MESSSLNGGQTYRTRPGGARRGKAGQGMARRGKAHVETKAYIEVRVLKSQIESI